MTSLRYALLVYVCVLASAEAIWEPLQGDVQVAPKFDQPKALDYKALGEAAARVDAHMDFGEIFRVVNGVSKYERQGVETILRKEKLWNEGNESAVSFLEETEGRTISPSQSPTLTEDGSAANTANNAAGSNTANSANTASSASTASSSSSSSSSSHTTSTTSTTSSAVSTAVSNAATAANTNTLQDLNAKPIEDAKPIEGFTDPNCNPEKCRDKGNCAPPKCEWECEKAKCPPPECSVECKQAACDVECLEEGCSCAPKCEPPKCQTRCEKGGAPCVSCPPPCKNYCSDPKCTFDCSKCQNKIGQICRTKCKDPICRWDCKEPTCTAPKCALKCTTPKNVCNGPEWEGDKAPEGTALTPGGPQGGPQGGPTTTVESSDSESAASDNSEESLQKGHHFGEEEGDDCEDECAHEDEVCLDEVKRHGRYCRGKNRRHHASGASTKRFVSVSQSNSVFQPNAGTKAAMPPAPHSTAPAPPAASMEELPLNELRNCLLGCGQYRGTKGAMCKTRCAYSIASEHTK